MYHVPRSVNESEDVIKFLLNDFQFIGGCCYRARTSSPFGYREFFVDTIFVGVVGQCLGGDLQQQREIRKSSESTEADPYFVVRLFEGQFGR